MNEFLNLLSNPYEIDVNLKISDRMLTAFVKQYVKYPGVKNIQVVCHNEYIEITLEVGMFQLSKKFKIELELIQIIITKTKLVVVLADHGNTLPVISNLLGLIGLKTISIITIKDGKIQIDLSKQWTHLLDNQDVLVSKQLKSTEISNFSVINGFILMTIVNKG